VQEFEDEIRDFFANHSADSKEERIHVVWYVVDGTSCRFEPFEKVFCSTVLADIPKIILVNKADLCRPSEIQALKKTIEGLQIPKCASVMPTVAVETLKPPPDKCPNCGSDDVSALRKKRIWKCNECDSVGSLENQSSLEDSLLRRVVEATQMIVPEYVKEAFISGQRISINTKIACTKGIITECFNAFKDTNKKLAIRRVLQLLARICTLWDISSGDPNEEQTVAMPVAHQVLSMALPLLRQGRSQEDMELSDEIRKDTHVSLDELGNNASQDVAAKEGQQEASSSLNDSGRTLAEREDDMKWTWVFVGKVQKTLEVLDQKFPSSNERVRIAHQRKQEIESIQQDSLAHTPRYSLDSSRSMINIHSSAISEEAGIPKSELAESEQLGRARSRSSSASTSPVTSGRRALNSDEVASQDVQRSRFSLELPPSDLFGGTAASRTYEGHQEHSGDPQCCFSAQQSMCPSHACLVTTAVAIVWSESLMKMHLLIVERGIKVHKGLSTVARVRSCFDRAFASFNIDRIEMAEEKLSQLPLNDVLDSFLVMPEQTPSVSRVPPAPTPSPMSSALASPMVVRVQRSVSAAASPSIGDQ